MIAYKFCMQTELLSCFYKNLYVGNTQFGLHARILYARRAAVSGQQDLCGIVSCVGLYHQYRLNRNFVFGRSWSASSTQRLCVVNTPVSVLYNNVCMNFKQSILQFGMVSCFQRLQRFILIKNNLQELFSDIGPLLSARMTGSGQASVTYTRKADAVKAIEAYHNRWEFN